MDEKDESKTLPILQQLQVRAKFKGLKRSSLVPTHDIKIIDKFRGKLFKTKGEFSHEDNVPFLFYRRELKTMGQFRKRIPVEEHVLATGKVAIYCLKDCRRQLSTVEVLSTQGVGFLYVKNLTKVKIS